MAVNLYEQHRPREATITVSQGDPGQNQDYSGDFVCSGVADGVELNAAIVYVNGLGGGSVVILNGVYTISATVNVSANISIFLYGELFLANGVDDHLITITGDHVEIVGGILDGNKANQTVACATKYVVNVANHDDFIIRYCYLENSYDDAIKLDTVNNFSILYNTLVNCGETTLATSDAIDLDTVTYGRVEGNYIETPTHDAIDCNDSSDHVIITLNTINDPGGSGIIVNGNTSLIISDNSIYSAGDYGIWVGATSVHSVVSGNYVTETTSDGIVITNNSSATVDNNISYNNGRHGILLTNGADKTIISNNLCSTNTMDGINISATAYLIICGNICHTNVNDGIDLGDCDHSSISDNICFANDSGDTGNFHGIKLDSDSTHNLIDGNICRVNHGGGIQVSGASNSILGNHVLENDRIGIYVDGADCKINDNLAYNNGQDANNTYSGIQLHALADRCTVNDNTSYSSGATRQRHGIFLENGVINCVLVGNMCYNNASDGIQLQAGNNDCFLTGNYLIENSAFGIRITGATCNRNYVKNNFYNGNTSGSIFDNGTDTKLATKQIQLIQGTTFISTAGEAWGWLINADTNFALGIGWLPLEVQQVVRIRVIGVALAAPGAGDYMRIQITGEGGTFDENFATEPIDVVDHNNEEVNVAIDDAVNWVFDATDDADIGDLLGGDRLQIKVLHEGAGNGDAATNAIVDTLQIEYV